MPRPTRSSSENLAQEVRFMRILRGRGMIARGCEAVPRFMMRNFANALRCRRNTCTRRLGNFLQPFRRFTYSCICRHIIWILSFTTQSLLRVHICGRMESTLRDGMERIGLGLRPADQIDGREPGSLAAGVAGLPIIRG